MSKKHKKRTMAARIYSNRFIMFILSMCLNVLLIGLILWLSRYAKIKGDLFASLIGVIIIFGLILNMIFLLGYGKNLKFFRQIFFFITSLLLIGGVVGTVYIVRAEVSLSNLVNKAGEETVEYAVIGFQERDTEDTMDGKFVGFMRQTNEFEAEIKEKISDHSKSVQYIEYKNYNDLLSASLEGEINYALVPLNYARLEDSFVDSEIKPFDNAHVLFTFSTIVDDDFNFVEVTKEPFSILLLGNNEGLSDSIILATVNPQTLRITMTSLARDTYLPIACYPGQASDKLNHSRMGGRQCLVDTVEDWLDVDIDFYFETDFYALEKIIDALGGLEIDSPVTFAGSFPIEGQPNEYEGVTVPAGLNLLNGKQAVTFARERHNLPGSDFGRQMNQQYVIREIAAKLINERNPERLVSVLEGASNNIKMNISVKELTSLLGYAINETGASTLDPLSTFRIVQTQITGDSPTISGMSVVVPYERDVEMAKKVIKYNLQAKIGRTDAKDFEFSIKKPYKLSDREYSDDLINTNDVQDDDGFIVPYFISDYTQKEIKAWGRTNGVVVNIMIIDPSSDDYRDDYEEGQIIHQSLEDGEYYSKPSSITISVVSKTKPEDSANEADPEGNTNETLPESLPDTSWSLDAIETWGRENGIKIQVVTIEGDGKGRITHVSDVDPNSKTIVVTFDKSPIVP